MLTQKMTLLADMYASPEILVAPDMLFAAR